MAFGLTVKLTEWTTLDDTQSSSDSVQLDTKKFVFSREMTIEWS
jgi:hypothetical protein